MQKLISNDKEPITPFIENVQNIYKSLDISTILVVGSCGDYFSVADTIIQMDSYEVKDVTAQAKELCITKSYNKFKNINIDFNRVIHKGLISYNPRGVKIKSNGKEGLVINRDLIDLKSLEQIVDHEQVLSIGYIIKYAEDKLIDNSKTLQEIVSLALDHIENNGLLSISSSSYGNGNLALPRKQEIIGAINRYRNLK